MPAAPKNITINCLRYLAVGFSLFFITVTLTHAGNRAITDAPASNNASIVVSIKPLYSLVAQLTDGIETPVLLMRQPQSPHHYNIRPSERRLLANARMIIWLGPELELTLDKIIQQSSAAVVTVMQAENLELLTNRTKYSSHDERLSEITIPSAHELEAHRSDPHIWLSSHNAIAISRHISQQLIAHDAVNTEQYQANLQRLIARIERTAVFIKATLQATRQPFIAYHDAFQYFEKENGLNFIAAISTDDETSASLKYMREITGKIEKENISCLVYLPPKPAIIETLARQNKMHAVMLDVLGITLSDDKNAWFELMQQLATNFSQCLTER